MSFAQKFICHIKLCALFRAIRMLNPYFVQPIPHKGDGTENLTDSLIGCRDIGIITLLKRNLGFFHRHHLLPGFV